MKGFLIFIFGLGAGWDVTTSFLGIVGLFGVTELSLSNWESIPQSMGVLISALIGSLVILGLSLNTQEMWDKSADSTYKILRPLHILAILYDAYSSYLGTAQNILLRESQTNYITIGFNEVLSKLSFEQQGFLIFLTIVVTISPIMISKLREQ